MKTRVLVGAQWGDEGKGKIIDILSENADMVVRSQGGNNAGHTVVVGDQVYKLHLTPSGILYPKADCIISNGCVVDPKVLMNEIDGLRKRGIDISRLKIDSRAHVILPYHIELDGLSESAKGSQDIGTTKKGIGPCYMDKAERIGIRMVDFINEAVFFDKLKANVAFKNKIITMVYGGNALDADAIFAEYKQYAAYLKPFVTDTTILVYEAIMSGKKVLFEGAQGALLDLDVGTYPYVTSSHPIAGGVCIGAGVGPTLLADCLGIAKAYTTRVGKGPFPTELDNEIGESIRTKGGEFGTTTGRPRRCGWFDAVIVRFAVRVNGLTGLAINKLDILSGLDKIKICVSYKRDGKIIRHFPADLSELAGCEPVYEEYDGWKEDISKATRFDELPINAQKYIKAMEKECGCKICMVGVGPERAQNFNI